MGLTVPATPIKDAASTEGYAYVSLRKSFPPRARTSFVKKSTLAAEWSAITWTSWYMGSSNPAWAKSSAVLLARPDFIRSMMNNSYILRSITATTVSSEVLTPTNRALSMVTSLELFAGPTQWDTFDLGRVVAPATARLVARSVKRIAERVEFL